MVWYQHLQHHHFTSRAYSQSSSPHFDLKTHNHNRHQLQPRQQHLSPQLIDNGRSNSLLPRLSNQPFQRQLQAINIQILLQHHVCRTRESSLLQEPSSRQHFRNKLLHLHGQVHVKSSQVKLIIQTTGGVKQASRMAIRVGCHVEEGEAILQGVPVLGYDGSTLGLRLVRSKSVSTGVVGIPQIEGGSWCFQRWCSGCA